MQNHDFEYEIRLAQEKDIDAIMNFIEEYWKNGHILAHNKTFFQYEFLNSDDTVNFVIAINKKKKTIEGITGFLRANNSRNPDIWGSFLKVKPGNLSTLAFELINFRDNISNCKNDLGIGINPDTSAKMHDVTGRRINKMDHFYLLNNDCDYRIAKIKNATSIKAKCGDVEVSSLNSHRDFEEFYDLSCEKDRVPRKDFWYIKHRYYDHPIYQYIIKGFVKNNSKMVIIFREQKYNGHKILRIIDCLGDYEVFTYLSDYFKSVLKYYKYEYIDLYCFGIDKKIISNCGFRAVEENDENIIPNYFAPFLQKNIDIWISSENENAVFFKGDGDQDRPNFTPIWFEKNKSVAINSGLIGMGQIERIDSKKKNAEQSNIVPQSVELYGEKVIKILTKTIDSINFNSSTGIKVADCIDSLALVKIIAALNSEFNIKIPYYEIKLSNFVNKESICSLIWRIKNGLFCKYKVATEHEYSAEKIGEQKTCVEEEKTLQNEKDKFVPSNFTSVLEAIKYYSAITPLKLCVSDGKNDFTYKEYIKLIKTIAAYLKLNKVKKGDKVIVEAIQTPYYIAIEMALHALDAVFVPMEKGCAQDKLINIARRCKGRLIISVDKIEQYTNITYDLLETCSCKPIDDIELPSENDISEILFSTGTTGKEKGIVLSHKSSVSVAENIFYGTGMRNSNIELIPSPLNHSHGLRSYYANMIAGATVIVLDGVTDVGLFFDTIEKYNVNSIDLVPAALSIILRLSNDQFGKYNKQLRFIEFGSAPMLDEDRNKIISLLPNVPLYNFYGSTEAGRTTVYNFNTPNIKNKCIGKPTYNSTLFIVDDNKSKIQSSKDYVGLLACSGPMCLNEYYEDEEETKSVIIDGIVYSNDEAYFDEDGDIILLGRRGDVINIGGKKVSPEEIESIANLIPEVDDCGCISVPDPVAGNVSKLFVQMKSKENFDSKKIREFLASKLEPYKIPAEIVFIEKIPRMYNGKLSRKELRNL